MTTKKPTLAQFAEARQPPPCHFCTLPERPECDEAYRAGVPRRVILDWLYEVHGYATTGISGVSQSALDKHFTKGHHHAQTAAV